MTRRKPTTPTKPTRQPIDAAQADLFDAPASQAAPAAAVLAIPVPAAAMSKAQRTFNRLIGQIRQHREQLAVWQDCEVHYQRRLAADFLPLQARTREAQRDLLGLFDGLLEGAVGGVKLSKSHRRKLRAWVVYLADILLEQAPDADIESVHDKYSDVSHADLQQAELASAQALFGQVLGEDMMQGHSAESMDDLLRHATQSMADKAQKNSDARQDRDRPSAESSTAGGGSPQQRSSGAKRQAAAELAAELAAKQASQSVREIFRKLASALHPDREPDATQRARKTALMQQANQAYERNDLLTLLSMQLDLEQIDDQHLAGLSDERLAHYNQVLQAQVQALQHEVVEAAAPFAVMLGRLGTRRQPAPAEVDAALRADIASLRRVKAEIDSDARLLRDPATRRAWLDRLALPDTDDDGPDALELALLMDAMGDLATPTRRRGQRRRR